MIVDKYGNGPALGITSAPAQVSLAGAAAARGSASEQSSASTMRVPAANREEIACRMSAGIIGRNLAHRKHFVKGRLVPDTGATG